MSLVTRQSVLQALTHHVGQDSGVTARILVTEIQGRWTASAERQLRAVVVELRNEGVAIVAHPSSGYFVAADAAELQRAIRFLRQRAITSFRQIRQLKRLALPPINGQRRLML